MHELLLMLCDSDIFSTQINLLLEPCWLNCSTIRTNFLKINDIKYLVYVKEKLFFLNTFIPAKLYLCIKKNTML